MPQRVVRAFDYLRLQGKVLAFSAGAPKSWWCYADSFCMAGVVMNGWFCSLVYILL